MTGAWVCCWITAPGHAERAAHVTGNTTDLGECDGRRALLFGQSGRERGVHVCEARSCEQGGEDTARPCGNLERLTEQLSHLGAYCLLGVKEGMEGYPAKRGKKKTLELRKRAIKRGTS